jgi:hypothetical protein
LDAEGNEIQFVFKKDGERGGNANAKDDVYNFVYNGVLDMMTQQETVFNSIAKDVRSHSVYSLIGDRFML